MSRLPQMTIPEVVSGKYNSYEYVYGLYCQACEAMDFYGNRYKNLSSAVATASAISSYLTEIEKNLNYSVSQLGEVSDTLAPIIDTQFNKIKTSVAERTEECQDYHDASTPLCNSFGEYVELLNNEREEALNSHTEAERVAMRLGDEANIAAAIKEGYIV